MPKPVIGPYPLRPPVCVEYDPHAAGVAHRVAELIVARLPCVTVEHVGSTAVPGCGGKGIVDLMVLYPNGRLEAVKAALDAMGFQRQSVGHRFPESRPMRVGAIEHEGKTFRLHVHVIAAASEEVAQLRAFRDWLRADPQRVRAYVGCKKAILADGVTDPAAYTAMKSRFVQEVLDDLQRDGNERRTCGGHDPRSSGARS